ncbi:MAG: hypothetical protein HC769_20190 [Cyanobacteria bacterium CRU_2_1]|nr:hypothetical protein [Cyanobacteria bacterium RU_5_0]NJR60937.1 hypothetical protein [Cyanobacteria bacterium CRU_2_1]
MAIAQAARLSGEAELTEFIPELVAALNRSMINPTVTDQGCWQKRRSQTLCISRANERSVVGYLSWLRLSRVETGYSSSW